MDLQKLKELVQIDSPSGFTEKAAKYVVSVLREYGLFPEVTHKGGVRVSLSDEPARVSVVGHFDTLGGVVSHITSSGTLRISPVGGFPPSSFEGGYVRVRTLSESVFTGTFLIDNPSAHASRDVKKTPRVFPKMHVRLDERVQNQKEVEELGISVGDFVCFEPHYTETESGFIKSRFMDNKAGCFVLFEVARRVKEQGLELPAELFFSSFEEVGHGACSSFPDSVEQLLVIDMGVVGKDIPGDEHSVSICAKDSSGPYDYRIRERLTELARQNDLPHHVSVYPFYRSDGSAALYAGNDFRVGLIGPGVSASHGVERTHQSGIAATVDLTLAYLQQFV